ncbi:MAG: mutS2 [Deltaproteobacteria bacterium]|nr:mutS2 [Deltaproteobacteria bacterium]
MQVSSRTLETLEWPLLVGRLRAHARTPGGRRRCEPEASSELFAADPDAARVQLAETSEARAVLERAAPPFGGLSEIGPALLRAERGGELGAGDLLDIASAIEAVEATQQFLAREGARAPLLAGRAANLGRHLGVAEAIARSIDAEGQVRDSVSPVLAEARAESRRLGGELQRRLDTAVHDPEIAPHLSDSFVTVRNDRYVLPVRADARGRVPGIVHDVSASGTTLFIEPQAVVDANNRLKEAELRAAREVTRVLRELSSEVGREAPLLRASLALLEELDVAFARGALSREMEAVEPTLHDAGVFVLPQLRHPLLPRERAVPNDLRLGESHHVLVLSGPNAGGKTVAMKSIALAALCARAGLHVAAAPGARVDWTERLLSDIGDAQNLRENLSTFSAHLANLARIVDVADARTLVVLDEIGDGTDPGEGAALAQSVLEALATAGARVVVTTHYALLKELAQVDARFENGSFEFDAITLAPTYRLRVGTPGASSALAVAARMGLRSDVLARANELLDREDRRLERTLAELSSSRVALDRERRDAERAREESEATRDELRRKLLQLQERRDRLFEGMRRDLDVAFQRAHGDVAAVIRELQRGGADARDAARAREKLLAIAAQAREVETELEHSAEASPGEPSFEALDWRDARPGDRVLVRGGGPGSLVSLPDRRGRVGVQVGGARLVVPVERIGRIRETEDNASPRTRVSHVSVDAGAVAGEHAGGIERCDLRGLRVEQAVAQVAAVLDRAALRGCERVHVVHGLGTGALRDAIRAHLATSPYVARLQPGHPDAGGEGVTEILLR